MSALQAPAVARGSPCAGDATCDSLSSVKLISECSGFATGVFVAEYADHGVPRDGCVSFPSPVSFVATVSDAVTPSSPSGAAMTGEAVSRSGTATTSLSVFQEFRIIEFRW